MQTDNRHPDGNQAAMPYREDLLCDAYLTVAVCLSRADPPQNQTSSNPKGVCNGSYSTHEPWYNGKLVGQNAPLKLKDI
jgi:hypothetical protein